MSVQPSAPLSGSLSALGHGLGGLGAGTLALSTLFALTAQAPTSLLAAAIGTAVGLFLSGLYVLTLGRIFRRQSLTLHLSADEDSLLLQISSGHRLLRIHRYRLADITDCGLTPVDSGFSSLWRPYLGLGQPPRRVALPLGCGSDLRRLPPDQFGAMLAALTALLEQHQPQALHRLQRDGAAYG